MSPTRPNPRAALGPVYSDALTNDLAVSIVARGAQDTTVSTGHNAEGPHVTVRVGRTLVYCYDEEAIAWHVAAWREAATRAARSFPTGHTAPRPDLAQQDGRSVGSAVLHIAGRQGRKLRNGKAGVVPVPFVAVQVGQLTTVALDPAAVTSTLTAWETAETAAENLFRPDPDNLTPAAITAFEREARRG